MEDKLFQELLKSIQQADSIIKGDLAPSRVFKLEANSVRVIRERRGIIPGSVCCLDTRCSLNASKLGTGSA